MYFRKNFCKAPIQTTNIDLPGLIIEQTPTESFAGGALIYIPQNLSYKPQHDLQIYCPKGLESVFIELLILYNKYYLIVLWGFQSIPHQIHAKHKSELVSRKNSLWDCYSTNNPSHKDHRKISNTDWFFLNFNWDSLHARLNSHYEGWSYKKKKHKKIKAFRKSV